MPETLLLLCWRFYGAARVTLGVIATFALPFDMAEEPEQLGLANKDQAAQDKALDQLTDHVRSNMFVHLHRSLSAC